MLSIGARTWFWAESPVSAREIEISHGWTTTPTGPAASSVDTISSPPSRTTSVRPSTRSRASPVSRFPPASSATNGLDGRRDQILGRARLDDSPLDEHRDPVGDRGRVHEVVRDEDRRQPELAQERAQLCAHAPARVRVERGHRLVQEQHLGPPCEGPRQGDPLALPSGKLAGLRLREPRDPEPLEQVAPACRLRRRRSSRRTGAGRARTPGARSRRRAARAGRFDLARGCRTRACRSTRSARALGRTSPATARSTVVLPAPEGPTSATVSAPTASATSTSKLRTGTVISSRAEPMRTP